MTRGLKWVGSLLWSAVLGYQKHNVNRISGSIAFYGILSLAPLAVILVTIAGYAFGQRAAEGLLVGQLQHALGQQSASAVQELIANAYRSRASVPATVGAVLVLIYSSTRLIGDVRGSLNTIWEVPGRGGGGFKGYFIGKAVDVAMVFGLAGLLLITLAAEIAANAITRYFTGVLPFSAAIFQTSTILFSLVIATAVFVVVLRFLPNTRLALRDVALGGCISAVLFTIGNYALGYYLGRTSPGSIFGAAGSFVLIMVWMYYSSLIVLFGVEITRAHWEHHHKVNRTEYQSRGGDEATGGGTRPVPTGPEPHTAAPPIDPARAEVGETSGHEGRKRSTPTERRALTAAALSLSALAGLTVGYVMGTRHRPGAMPDDNSQQPDGNTEQDEV